MKDVQVVEGDSLEVLRTLQSESFDAVITDPPYSSGGMTLAVKSQLPSEKYQQHGTKLKYPEFGGDNRDARSWAFWSHLWLSQAFRVTKPGGYCLVFTDWRQLPGTTDVLQAGGWVWRGIIAWDKTAAARSPHKGYFRHQCEYVVWGTKGKCTVPPIDDPRKGPWPGCIAAGVKKSEKHHLTGKPVDLMRKLVQVCPPGGKILDPFAGSGSTGLAAAIEGRRCTMIEKETEYVAIARHRLSQCERSNSPPR